VGIEVIEKKRCLGCGVCHSAGHGAIGVAVTVPAERFGLSKVCHFGSSLKETTPKTFIAIDYSQIKLVMLKSEEVKSKTLATL